MTERIEAGKRWLLLWPVLLLACSVQGTQSESTRCSGRLVIAGGAVQADNAPLFEALLDRVNRDPDSRVAVITAASASPVESANRFSATLSSYGIDSQRVDHVRLAVRDDASTRTFDERRWINNASSPEEIAKIERAQAIWFAGGDQSRYIATLVDDAGNATPMLERLKERLSDCATFGGTSAGAAIMSDLMITGGGSMGALLGRQGNDDAETYAEGDALEPLSSSVGLGFFPFGIVDQHFGERARLGRLAAALERMPQERRLGFGIDENTALVMEIDSGSFDVVGAGSVTVVDGRSASWSSQHGKLAIDNLKVSILSPGDRLNIRTGDLVLADYLAPTVGNEYSDFEPVSGGGLALPHGSVSDTVGSQLLDNAGTNRVDYFSFVMNPDAATASGVRYRFEQRDDSAGYWGRDASGRERYTLLAVSLSISPADVRISQPAVE